MSAAIRDSKAYLDEPAAGRLNIRYAPDPGDVLVENPPRFTWLPVVEDEALYVLRLSTDPHYPAKETQVFADIPLNFFTPDSVLEPGPWHWSYAVWDAAKAAPVNGVEQTRSFDLAADLPATPLPGRTARYAGADLAHPAAVAGPETAGRVPRGAGPGRDALHLVDLLRRQSVLPWMDREIMDEPAGYPDHQRDGAGLAADLYRLSGTAVCDPPSGDRRAGHRRCRPCWPAPRNGCWPPRLGLRWAPPRAPIPTNGRSASRNGAGLGL